MKRKKVSSQPASNSSLRAYQYRRLRSNRADNEITFVSIGMESTVMMIVEIDSARRVSCHVCISHRHKGSKVQKVPRQGNAQLLLSRLFQLKRPETINVATNLLLWIVEATAKVHLALVARISRT